MSQKVYKEIRTVSYPVIMGGQAFDRIGVFEVDFSASGRPLQATMLRFVGYESIKYSNWCFPAVRHIGVIGGKAELVAF